MGCDVRYNILCAENPRKFCQLPPPSILPPVGYRSLRPPSSNARQDGSRAPRMASEGLREVSEG